MIWLRCCSLYTCNLDLVLQVVDARAGPGTKSMNKIKNKAKLEEKLLKKKHKHRYRKPKNVKSSAARARSSGGLSDDVPGKKNLYALLYTNT